MRLTYVILFGFLSVSIAAFADGEQVKGCQSDKSVDETCTAIDIQLTGLKELVPMTFRDKPGYLFNVVDGSQAFLVCDHDVLLNRPKLWVNIYREPHNKDLFQAVMSFKTIEACDQTLAQFEKAQFPQTIRLSVSADRNKVHVFYEKVGFPQ